MKKERLMNVFNAAGLMIALAVVVSCTKEDPEPEKDSVAPTVLSVEPADGATNVSIATNIVAVISEPIDLSSVSTSSFKFTISGETTTIGGSFSVDGAKIAFDPTEDLAYSTKYSVFIDAGVKDSAGNGLKDSEIIVFTTEPNPDSSSPIVASISPKDKAVEVSLDANIEITFSEPIDLGSVSDQTVILTTPAFSNNIQADVSISGNVMTLDPAVDMEQGSVYTLKLKTGLLDLAGNGLESEFESSFTTLTLDQTAPTIAGVNPGNGESNVALDVNIEITFSEPIDLATVSDNTIKLTTPALANNIQLDVTMDGNVMTLNPTVDLEHSSEYTLWLGTGLKDVAGNGLEAEFESGFTTLIVDETAPTVESFSIANGATNVSVNEVITITFSEPMDEASLAGNITLRHQASKEQVGLSFDVSGNAVIVTPNGSLKGNSQYNLDVTTFVTDVAGNRLDFAKARVFFTENLALQVVSTVPANDAEGIKIDDNTVTVVFSSNVDPATVNSTNFSVVEVSTGGGESVVNGTYQVNGTEVIFTASESLKEYKTQYKFYLTNGLKDQDGNTMDNSQEVYSFYTEEVSENYYYHFINSSTGHAFIYNIGGDYIFPGNSAPQSTQQQWKFTWVNYGYAISNRYLLDQGKELYMGPTTPITSDVVLSAPASSGSPKSRQIWYVTNADGSGNYAFSLPTGSVNIYFNYNTFKFDYSTKAEDPHLWQLQRGDKIAN